MNNTFFENISIINTRLVLSINDGVKINKSWSRFCKLLIISLTENFKVEVMKLSNGKIVKSFESSLIIERVDKKKLDFSMKVVDDSNLKEKFWLKKSFWNRQKKNIFWCWWSDGRISFPELVNFFPFNENFCNDTTVTLINIFIIKIHCSNEDLNSLQICFDFEISW